MSQNITQTLPYLKNRQYDAAINQLSLFIEDQSNHNLLSTLYANRGTLYLANGKFTQALDDLTESLHCNHLNYAAYFNLFSIYAMKKYSIEALKNLCCALSCLYLIRGKNNKNETDLTKAIKYSENNVEARLLKGFMNMEKKKYKIALNQINWVIQIQPHNQTIHQLKAKIIKLIEDDSDSRSSRYSKISQSFDKKTDQQAEEPKARRFRLLCTTYDDQTEDFDVLSETTKKLTQFNELYSQLNGDHTSIISKQPIIHLLQRSQKPKSLQSQLNKHKMVSSFVEDDVEEQEKGEKKKTIFQKVSQTESLEGSDIHLYPQQSLKMEQPSNLQKYLFQSKKSDIKQSTQSKNSQLGQSNSTFTLQALEEGKSISIRVHQIQINPKQKAQYKNVYCQFDDGTKQGKKLFNESFQAQLEDQPQILHIKVFNKEMLAFHDTFIGEGFKEITMTGRTDVPIYFENESNIIGRVLLDIKFT